MESNIALIASSYLLARIGVLAVVGYLVYRVLRPAPAKIRIPVPGEYNEAGYSPTRPGR